MDILLLNGSIFAKALRALGHRVSTFWYVSGFDAAGARIREFSLESAIENAGFTPELEVDPEELDRILRG